MAKANELKDRRRMKDGRNIGVLLFTLILLSEVFALVNSNFLSSYNLVSIGQSVAPYAVLSLGAIFPIALGYTDLSTGAVCIGSAVVAGKLYAFGMPLWAVIPVMILFGTLIGFVNGLLVSNLKLPPFIVTLGTMMFIRGAAALFANQPNVLFPTNSWYNRMFSTVNGIPIGFVWVVLIALLCAWFFKKSRTGRHILAVGSCEKAAVIAGLDAKKLKVVTFTISGMMAGIAAVLWCSSFATVTVATGNGMELDAIAGAYIGGCAAAGGSVSTAGSVIGAMLLVVLRNGLNFVLAKLNIPLNSTYVTYVITGIIVVVSVFLDKTKERRSENSAAKKADGSIVKKYIIPAIALLLAVLMILSDTVIFTKNMNGENKTIALLMKSENNAFWNSVAAGAKDAADENGYRLISRGAQSEDSSQLPAQRELMDIMLSENPVGLGVSMIADGFTDLLEEAYDRKVPVIQYDSGLYASDAETISGSEKNPLRGYVKGDNYSNSALLAESVYSMLYDRISLSASFRIGIIQHENSVTSASRSSGFKERFTELAEADPKTAGKCQVYVEVKPSDANNAYKEALEALYEKGVSMVFMTAESVINQIYDAIAASETKYDGMYFAGYDAGVKAIEWLESDSEAVYLCGVSQDPYTMGRLTVETLIKISKGENVDELIVVPGAIYNLENYEELIEKKVISR